MKKTETVIKNLLLIFVFISIGYALGRHYGNRHPAGTGADTGKTEVAGSALTGTVTVYYMHTTFRCATCNTIEKMTRDLLKTNFSDELADGRIQFADVDFQENETLAKKFDISASSVVVAETENGKITGFRRLDQVWTLMNDPPKFNAYIQAAIIEFLGKP